VRSTRGTRRAIAVALVATGVAGLAACTGGSSATKPSGTPSAAGSSPVASPSASPTTSVGRSGPVTLSFAGDVHFASKLAPLLDDPAKALTSLKPYLGPADFSMVNLETSITTRGTAQPKQFHFRAPPTALEAVQSAGIDAVTMANNHAADYGSLGLSDTLKAVQDSPIPVVGIGADAAQAYAPAYVDLRGTKVAVLAAMQVPDWTAGHFAAGPHTPGVATAFQPARLEAAIRAAKQKADVVVVFMHWGTEYTACPNALQKSTAAALSAAGASVIVGAHVHEQQGAGWLGSTYVDYGLGNFVWWRRQTVIQTYSGVLTLTLTADKVTSARWVPMLVGASGLPAVPGAAERAKLTSYRAGLRACAGLSAHPA
jgi:poly-gamma-glutamate capsule biosynthesis protein CapA/YwtB (metallophosphatase superfamily)